jgi:hypothetical protein
VAATATPIRWDRAAATVRLAASERGGPGSGLPFNGARPSATCGGRKAAEDGSQRGIE